MFYGHTHGLILVLIGSLIEEMLKLNVIGHDGLMK